MGTAPNGLNIAAPREIASGLSLNQAGNVLATTKAALKALPSDARFQGMEALVLADRSRWYFDTALAVSDTTDNVLMTPDGGTGRWVRADNAFVMKLPIAFGLADNAVIFTVPEGFALRLTGLPYWETTTGWSGGSSSTIGVSSSRTGFTADGSLLGGAAGDVAATLVAGIQAGTIGVGLDSLAEIQAGLFEEADTIIYNEITSAFTAGEGFVCIPVALANAPLTP